MNQIVIFSWDKIKIYLKKSWWLLLGLLACIVVIGYYKVGKAAQYPEKYMITKTFWVNNVSETADLVVVENNLTRYIMLEEVIEEINTVLLKNGMDEFSTEKDTMVIYRAANSSIVVLQAISDNAERAAALADAYEEKLVLLDKDMIMGTVLTKKGETKAVPCYLSPSGRGVENINCMDENSGIFGFLISVEGIAIIFCALIVNACILLLIILFDKKIRWMPEIEKLFDIKYLGDWETEAAKIEKKIMFLNKKYNSSILICEEKSDLLAETAIKTLTLEEYILEQIAEINEKIVILAVDKEKARYSDLSKTIQTLIDYDGKVIGYLTV